MNTEERLDRLEKQNRNLRRGLVGLLLLVVVVPLAAFVWQDKKPKVTKFDTIEAETINARALTLVSPDGMSRVLIGAENGLATCQLIHGPGLLGTSRVILGAEKDSGVVGVGNQQYHASLMMDREAELMIAQKETTRFSASVDNESTALTITDKLGNIRVVVHEAGDRTALQLHDSHDKLRAALGAAQCVDKKTGLTIKRPNHSLILLDDKGNVIYQVPK